MKVDLTRDTWKKVGDLNYGDLFLSNGEAWLITMAKPSGCDNSVCVKLENGMVLEFLNSAEVECVPDAEVVYAEPSMKELEPLVICEPYGNGGKRI